MQEHAEVLSFWFEELEPEQHFKKDKQLDAEISRRFLPLHQRACADQLKPWRSSAGGRLAEIIILDQFSRNLYRDDPRAWAQDGQALALAMEMVASKQDLALVVSRRVFAYMPYMHSEDLKVQQESVQLFTGLGLDSNLKFARAHRDVIQQFGRFPYRNDLLGRDSSAAEIDYIEKHGSF